MNEILSRDNLDLNGEWNREMLPQRGRDADAYHSWVYEEMSYIDGLAQGNTDRFLDLYETRVRSVVRSNPDMLYSAYWRSPR